MVTDINGDTLKLERLKVSVWDKNTLSDTVLGRGTVSLRKAGTTLDTDVSMTVPVKDKFGQTTGEVTIVLQVQDSSVPKENEEGQGQDAIPTTGLFEIQEIHLNNLRNTGNTSCFPFLTTFLLEFFGKSDPYVKLSIGTNWKYTSDVKMNGGANVSWTNLNISKQFATSQISRDELKVVVFDKNSSRKDVELGAGSVTIRSALSSPQTWVNLRGDLFSGKQSYGQFQVKGRFIVNSKQPYAGDHATPVEDPQKASKSQAEDLKKIMEMQNQVDKKMGGMEDTLKQQMQKVRSTCSS